MTRPHQRLFVARHGQGELQPVADTVSGVIVTQRETMPDSNQTSAEEAIQRRLALLGNRPPRWRMPSQFGLRGLFIVFTLAPVLIWRMHLAWADIISGLKAAKEDALLALLITRPQGTEDRALLIYAGIVPVLMASTVLAVTVFVIVRRLGEHAKYGAFAALCCGGASVIVTSVFWAQGQGGLITVALANSLDIAALYALPSGIAAMVGAAAGWLVAELE